jgi:regulator of nucleoside diphosphate kinase
MPNISELPEIIVTRWDVGRLDHLIRCHAPHRPWRAVEPLVRQLIRARIVEEDEIPATIVTMGSRVEYCDSAGCKNHVGTLVYPDEREFYDDALSVLTPVGAALLGLSEGGSSLYAGSDGRRKTISVVSILYQPEASRRERRYDDLRNERRQRRQGDAPFRDPA